jgi:serine/threonine-protein kinase
VSEEFGSYTVYEQLGVGGMASVHVAESRSSGGFRKRVALKRLLPHAAADPDLVRSFIDEARLVRYLKHANIAQTYDFGKVGDIYFIAMELVAGPTVTQLMRQCDATIGVIPFPITLNILIQLCDALDYAHNLEDEHGKPLGIIHRDVSPPNVIISNTGIVKLIDFGVAKAASSTMQTHVGTVKGKFSYMAPEYLSGQLDARVDLWALGAIAHEMLTNRRLFDADEDIKVLDRVKNKEIVPPSTFNPDVPADLDQIVMTALQRDPSQRWQSAAAMRTALENAAAELQTIVTSSQLIEWVEWSFSQKPPGEDSELSQLIRILETPSKSGSVKGRALPKDGDKDAKPKGGKAKEKPAMVERRGGGGRLLLLLILLAIAGGAGYAAWRYGVPPELMQAL